MKDPLTQYFADQLEQPCEIIDGYYGEWIKKIKHWKDIEKFAETMTDKLKDEHKKVSFFTSDSDDGTEVKIWLLMTYAWERMEEDEDDIKVFMSVRHLTDPFEKSYSDGYGEQ